MKICSIGIFIIFNCTFATAQNKLYTKTGTISFFSKTNIENIAAKNNKVLAVWELATGKLELSVLMKGFEFEKALMQEHFNESYVESDKYPKATFKGNFENFGTLNLSTNKSYTAIVKGVLTMHGASKNITLPTNVKVENGQVSATANFVALLADYNIKIPNVVSANINKTIDISINIPAFKVL